MHLPLVFFNCCLMSYLTGIENVRASKCLWQQQTYVFNIPKYLFTHWQLVCMLCKVIKPKNKYKSICARHVRNNLKGWPAQQKPWRRGKESKFGLSGCQYPNFWGTHNFKDKLQFCCVTQIFPILINEYLKWDDCLFSSSYCQLVLSLFHCYRMTSAIPSECTWNK